MVLNRLCLFLATGLHLSYIPVAVMGRRKWSGAGFIGTLVGLATAPWVSPWVLVPAIAASAWVCGRAERLLGAHDDPRIVLDEIVGYWTTVALLPATPAVLLGGFALFRFFDAFKFEPYASLEKLPGGWGVVGDDVGAGLVSNVILRGVLWLAS